MTAEVAHHRADMMLNGVGYLKRFWQNPVTRVALAALLLSLLPIR